jgi:hypothetical protein
MKKLFFMMAVVLVVCGCGESPIAKFDPLAMDTSFQNMLTAKWKMISMSKNHYLTSTEIDADKYIEFTKDGDYITNIQPAMSHYIVNEALMLLLYDTFPTMPLDTMKNKFSIGRIGGDTLRLRCLNEVIFEDTLFVGYNEFEFKKIEENK